MSMVINHPNMFEWNGVWYGVTGPVKCGCRSLRDTLKRINPYPDIHTTSGMINIAAEHHPKYDRIFKEAGFRPDRFEVILLARNPYHRLRSWWRNHRNSMVRNQKLTFANWLTQGFSLESILYSIRHKGRLPNYYRLDFENVAEVKRDHVDPYQPDAIHIMKLESRAEDWNELGIFELRQDVDWSGYRSSPDDTDDIEYYAKNPEIAELATFITKPDLEWLNYSFDNMTPGYGVGPWDPDVTRLNNWYHEYYEGRFKIID